MDIEKQYKTQRWKRLRIAILKRDNYLCQESKRYGKTVGATLVHHIYPAKQYPHLFYNPNNLISLSAKAHEKMHDRITDEITATGKRWQQRQKEKISPPIVEKQID